MSKHVSYAYYVPAKSSSWYVVSIKTVTEKELTTGTSHEYQHQICFLGTITQLWHGCFFKQEGLSRWLLVVKNPPTNAGDIRGLGRSPGGGHSNPLQYSCLENSMDRGAWGLSSGFQRVGHDWSDLACIHAPNKIIHSCHEESREQRKHCHGQWPNISLLKTH